MDALNASTDVKRKVPKRTRRLSSREDSKEEKKPDSAATTPTTPPVTTAAATSPVAVKPLLKVRDMWWTGRDRDAGSVNVGLSLLC